jgi:pimeloyl-ACP methyl ester carboxylesterase
MSDNSILYCVPGLGVDERAFGRLDVPGWSIRVLTWLRPERGEPLAAYARRMREQIDEEKPVVLGLSFGGMIALEMARQAPLGQVILLSSIKGHAEMPPWMRLSGRLRLHRAVPLPVMRFFSQFNNGRLGVRTPEEKAFVNEYRRKADPHYLNWAIDAIVRWKNDWQPEGLVHIHGSGDRIFPMGRMKPTHIIPNGTHLMVFNQAEVVSRVLGEVLGRREAEGSRQ